MRCKLSVIRPFAFALLLASCFLTPAQKKTIISEAEQTGINTATCVLTQVASGNVSAASIAVVCLLPDAGTAVTIAGQLATALSSAATSDAGAAPNAMVVTAPSALILRLRSVK